MSYWGQLGLVSPVSWIQKEMITFHDHAMVIIIGVFMFVSYLGLSLFLSKFSCRTLSEAQRLETIWTVIPALLLIFLALPSLRLLYGMEEIKANSMVVKATGHQWYWSYEVPMLGVESYDSYMIPSDYRLLEVDNRLALPCDVNMSVMTTSADVLHSWTIPSLGLKMDSVPGRLNLGPVNILVPGVYYGQCSEICGTNHSFMPIVIEAHA